MLLLHHIHAKYKQCIASLLLLEQTWPNIPKTQMKENTSEHTKTSKTTHTLQNEKRKQLTLHTLVPPP